jgi:transposase
MDEAVKNVNLSLEEVLAQNELLRRALEAKDRQIKLLEEKINYLLHCRFGPKSERFDDRQQSLFEDNHTDSAQEPAVEVEVPAHTRRRGGRRIPPKDLPHVRVEHDLPEEEKRCGCGNPLTRIGEECSFQYDVIPAKFQIIENVKFKYGCTNPQCQHPPKTAQQNPPPPLPRTQASPGLLAWIGTSKFVDGLPLNRITTIAEKRFGVPLTSTTLANWTIKGAEVVLSPLVEAMEKALLGCNYLHIDETTLQVLDEEGRKAQQKSYIWVRVTGGSGLQIVLMHYNPSRAGAVACQLLEGYSGYLQTDGYGGYNLPASRPDIIQLGCWAHVRRKFDAASRAASPGAAHIARQGIKLIRDLYHLDNQAKDKPPDERKAYRQKVVKPHLEKIRDWMLENQARALGRGGLLASAFTYLYNQWEKLTVFLEDPYLELDNNKAERHIRPVAIGRKTWLFAKSEAGARATAIWYSVIETARANGLEPYWYLRKIFEEMPLYLRDGKSVEALLPWNINPEELKQMAGRD